MALRIVLWVASMASSGVSISSLAVGRLDWRIRDSIQGRLDAREASGELVQRGAFSGRAEQFRVPRLRDWSSV